MSLKTDTIILTTDQAITLDKFSEINYLGDVDIKNLKIKTANYLNTKAFIFDTFTYNSPITTTTREVAVTSAINGSINISNKTNTTSGIRYATTYAINYTELYKNFVLIKENISEDKGYLFPVSINNQELILDYDFTTSKNSNINSKLIYRLENDEGELYPILNGKTKNHLDSEPLSKNGNKISYQPYNPTETEVYNNIREQALIVTDSLINSGVTMKNNVSYFENYGPHKKTIQNFYLSNNRYREKIITKRNFNNNLNENYYKFARVVKTRYATMGWYNENVNLDEYSLVSGPIGSYGTIRTVDNVYNYIKESILNMFVITMTDNNIYNGLFPYTSNQHNSFNSKLSSNDNYQSLVKYFGTKARKDYNIDYMRFYSYIENELYKTKITDFVLSNTLYNNIKKDEINYSYFNISDLYNNYSTPNELNESLNSIIEIIPNIQVGNISMSALILGIISIVLMAQLFHFIKR